jgi:hypothetical protein
VAAVNQSRQSGVQIVDGGILQGVDVHKWSGPGRLSFVPSPKGSQTGPDSPGKTQGKSTRSRRVVYKFQRIQATAHGYFVAPITAPCQAENLRPLYNGGFPQRSF